jgi:hypothetical protein
MRKNIKGKFGAQKTPVVTSKQCFVTKRVDLCTNAPFFPRHPFNGKAKTYCYDAFFLCGPTAAAARFSVDLCFYALTLEHKKILTVKLSQFCLDWKFSCFSSSRID